MHVYSVLSFEVSSPLNPSDVQLKYLIQNKLYLNTNNLDMQSK